MAANSAAVGGALEAPRIDFPPMESASAPARWLGLAPRFDVMATLEKGPLCYTTVLGKRIYFVNDAEFVKRILLDNVANYPKSVTYRNNLRPFLGDGLLISEGEFWKRQRRLAQPAFHLRRLKALAGAMAGAAGHMTKDWVHGKVIDVMAAMNAVTMEIVATTLFGADVSGDIARSRRCDDRAAGGNRRTCAQPRSSTCPSGSCARAARASPRRWRRSTASSIASSPSAALREKCATTCCRCCWKRATRTPAKA